MADGGAVPQHPAEPKGPRHATRDELLSWAKPLPPYEEMIIEGLTDEEEDAFLKAIADA